ncbi:hypothetical protein TNCT_223331 [Trichonephila clavata]|uniref:Uncharacterized protein n=1 Tax=Trichonephila clavata TaxID=2740835 RepID=A0A8X6F4G9_TRICU|nr:hypothetical protein TNCT_223331 [Trichonephila clavata]
MLPISPEISLPLPTRGLVIRQTDDRHTKERRQTEANHPAKCSRKLNAQPSKLLQFLSFQTSRERKDRGRDERQQMQKKKGP